MTGPNLGTSVWLFFLSFARTILYSEVTGSILRPPALQTWNELLHLSLREKELLGVSATGGEIAQQPATWIGTRKIFERQREALCAFLEAAGVTTTLEARPTVLLTGAGTSDYIGQVLTLLLRTEWGCEAQAVASTDLLTNMSDYLVPGRRYLLISFSRSGNSPEGVAVIAHALATLPEVKHLVVTCSAESRMIDIARTAKDAYVVVLDDAVNDRGLAMTSSFSNMVVFGQCLAHAWTSPAYEEIFAALTHAGEAFLPLAAKCAEELSALPFKRMCLLGSGALTGVARESALKVLEMTAGGVKTMAESVLGLRHGPMAAMDTDTLLVCYVSSDERRQKYEVDLLREVGAKGIVAKRVVVGTRSSKVLAECSDHFLAVQDGIPDLYRPPLDVIFGQLLGLYFSLAHGLKPDAPSPHGVISRVVSDFTIYE
jgi:tagatose-6-phosphate ketose/aldose isomerase